MRTELSESQINLWFKFIMLTGVIVVLYASAQSIMKYESLEREYANYRVQTDNTIATLNESLDGAVQQVKYYSAAQKEIQCLAMNIYFEAATESYEGMLAVAQVTKNRVKSKIYPKTYCGVVYQKSGNVCQFSWTCDGIADKVKSAKLYRAATQVAEEVLLSDKKSGIIGPNVMNYHANYVEPNWSKNKQLVATIGNHLFYGNRINNGN